MQIKKETYKKVKLGLIVGIGIFLLIIIFSFLGGLRDSKPQEIKQPIKEQVNQPVNNQPFSGNISDPASQLISSFSDLFGTFVITTIMIIIIFNIWRIFGRSDYII